MKKEVDFEALYVALNAKRLTHEMSWKAVAGELDISPSSFTNLSRGKGVDRTNFLTLTSWLGIASEKFLRDDPDAIEEAHAPETAAVVAGHLRADRSLKPESAKAIDIVLRAARARLADESAAL